MNNKQLQHWGVRGMRWGVRRGSNSGSSSSSSSKNSRKFKLESLKKSMVGRKVNKLFGKRNIKNVKKTVANILLTPIWSKTKWSDMSNAQKENATTITAAALAAVGTILIADGLFGD